MPGGFSVGQYVSLCLISISSMLLGGSITHNYYKPDLVGNKLSMGFKQCGYF